MIDRGTHQGVEKFFEEHLARDGLRDGDHSRKVEMFEWRGDRAGRSSGSVFGPRVCVALIDDLLQ